MRLICESRGIIERLRPANRINSILRAGFNYSVLSASSLCDPFEFRDIKRRNFKREWDIYFTDRPEKLSAEIEGSIIKNAKEKGLKLPVAMTPFVSHEVKDDDVDNEVLKRLAEETLKAAISAGCERIIVHPLYAGLDIKELWEVNRDFYLKLDKQADEQGSDIRILLINKGKDINGHLVRGICSEPEEMVQWVDELNSLAGKKRFSCCFDIGTATICGQNLYEAMVPLGERLESVIIRDCDGTHDVAMLPYSAYIRGQQTDWLYLIRALRKLDFDGDLIMSFAESFGAVPDQLRNHVLEYAHTLGEYFTWQIGMERMVKKYDKRVLFGAGNMCRAYMKNYGKDYPPLFTCDNNSARWGEEFCGLTIENPEKLKELPDDVAVFLCNLYYDEIGAQLREMGLKNPIERFNDEYMPTFHMDRLKMAADPNVGKEAKS